MRMFTFSVRTAKEIVRDPLNIGFGLAFPVILLCLFHAIQANAPAGLFEMERIAPGIAVFSLSFMSLFSATLLAKDRESALLQRLYATPLTAPDFIFGYTLPLLPIAVAQSILCYGVALLLGLKGSVNLFAALLFMIPVALFFIAVGLFCGSVFHAKQVGGICGALLTNVTALLSGAWFDVELVGGAFQAFAYALPFVHAVEAERAILRGVSSGMAKHILWVAGYGVFMAVAAVFAFLWQRKRH